MVAPCSCEASWLPIEYTLEGSPGCTWCGGSWRLTGRMVVMNAKVAGALRSFIEAGGEVVLIPRMNKVAYINPDQVVAPPGKAHLGRCPDCTQGRDRHGDRCVGCEGTGIQVWHACPRCGDIAMWRYSDDSLIRMHCDLCRASWYADYPGWLAQRLPQRLLPQPEPPPHARVNWPEEYRSGQGRPRFQAQPRTGWSGARSVREPP
jgi:hypothetical protein